MIRFWSTKNYTEKPGKNAILHQPKEKRMPKILKLVSMKIANKIFNLICLENFYFETDF